MNSLDPDFLRGSYPPVITPFLENGDVDYDSYEKLVDWQIREGSHGIVVNGTSAEPAVLTTEERKTLLEIGMRVAKGRVPVMAAPQPRPTKPRSEIGVSHNRSAPYLSYRPAVVIKFPPRAPIPSPITKISGFSAIA